MGLWHDESMGVCLAGKHSLNKGTPWPLAFVSVGGEWRVESAGLRLYVLMDWRCARLGVALV